MPAQVIDGKAVAASIRGELKSEVDALRSKYGKVPGLAAILVGARQDSQTYVRLKHKAAAECGFASFNITLPADVTQDDLLARIDELNANDDCHGILVQLPLPPHLHEPDVIARIAAQKDADALLPVNVGLLHSKGTTPLFVPCTPAGVLELLHRYNIAIAGKRAVVLGRSNIVGAPTAALLLRDNATVSIVHSHTPLADVVALVRDADIVVAAMGKPGFVQGEWIKPGAAVIDVGTTPVADASKQSGYRLVGDVCYDAAAARAAFVSPVPGGVGPMTIAMLLRNTLRSFRHAMGESV